MKKSVKKEDPGETLKTVKLSCGSNLSILFRALWSETSRFNWKLQAIFIKAVYMIHSTLLSQLPNTIKVYIFNQQTYSHYFII